MLPGMTNKDSSASGGSGEGEEEEVPMESCITGQDAASGSTRKKKVGLRINTWACTGKNAKDLFSATASYLGWREMEVDGRWSAPPPGIKRKFPPATVYCIMQTQELVSMLPLPPQCWATRYLGCPDLCDKGNLARMFWLLGDVVEANTFSFNPRTWLLPDQTQELRDALCHVDPSKRVKTVIVKPEDGSQGDGIFLAQNARELECKQGVKANKSAVAQRYLASPLLIQGFKFDFRVYVVLIGGSCSNPPRVFLCKEGLARFCTERYEAPTSKNLHKCMGHLTNYSLNKRSELFEHSGESMEEVYSIDSLSSKRPLSVALEQLSRDDPKFDSAAFYDDLVGLVSTTCALFSPALAHSGRGRHGTEDGQMRSCQVLGFDVILDDKRCPYLLEVNNSPSLAIDESLPLEPDEAEEHLKSLGSKIRSTEKLKGEAAICRCMDMAQPHRHRTSLVDLAIKQSVMGGMFRLLHRVNRAGITAPIEPPEQFVEVDVMGDPVYELLSQVEVVFNRGGGAAKAFTSAGLRRAFTPLCGQGNLSKTDLDIMSMKCRQTKFTSRDPAIKPDALRIFDYIRILQQVSAKAFPSDLPHIGVRRTLSMLGA